jgi:nucleotide-binding universal stress UspA family protein
MLKLLVYTDGTPASQEALRFAAALRQRLGAELAVVTVRSGTHAAEEPAPVGRELPLSQRAQLPQGPRRLLTALDELVDQDVLARPAGITLRDMPKGHMFVCKGADGTRIPFYELFGPFVEALNREVDEHGYDLLLIAPPRRGAMGRLVRGDTTRKLALDLHTSMLVVRGGGPRSRYVVCTDGSAASRRQFSLLGQLLPAISTPVELVCVATSEMQTSRCQEIQAWLQQAQDWLEACGQGGTVAIKKGQDPVRAILETAGREAIIVLGASLRHDVYRRVRGSLPLQVLAAAEASVLLVKRPAAAGVEFLKDPAVCATGPVEKSG